VLKPETVEAAIHFETSRFCGEAWQRVAFEIVVEEDVYTAGTVRNQF
jgi:hypothetical protein